MRVLVIRFINHLMPYFVTADVVIHLLKVECLPVLLYGLYGLNACLLSATDNKSFAFVICRTLTNVVDTFSRMAFNLPW